VENSTAVDYGQTCASSALSEGSSSNIVTGIRRRGAYVVRSARLVLTHPVEGVDRVRNRIEMMRWAGRDLPYTASLGWEAELHGALGVPWPCPEADRFNKLWERIGAEIGGFRHGHDADPAAARTAYCVSRHIMPSAVIETGVARGITSRAVLEGLRENNRGRLWSIDLPPTLEGWNSQVGAAVPDSLRERWVYVRGSSRRRLPKLLAVVGQIDFCLLASSLTEPTVVFETEIAWAHLRSGGVLLAEGVNRSRGFARLAQRTDVGLVLVAACEAKPEVFGIAVKAQGWSTSPTDTSRESFPRPSNLLTGS
jgi:hypothetical protein